MCISKKARIFIALAMLLYCISLIQTTYAKYVTSASATSTLSISRWSILVNNQDIVNSSNFSTAVHPVFEGTTNIREGIIAPTAEGYFDISIDAMQTDVSFNYTLSITPNANNTVDDLKIYKYSVNGVETTGSLSTLTNRVAFDATDEEKSIDIRVYVRWDDNVATQTMTNSDDSEAAQNGLANYDISLNFIQTIT